MLLERIIDKTWYTMEGVQDIYTLRCFVGTIEVERRFIYVEADSRVCLGRISIACE